MRDPPVCAILHHPGDFSNRSGMYPLVEALGAQPVFYDPAWEAIGRRSWRLGHCIRQAGIAWSGSTWNYLWPVSGEWALARRVSRFSPGIVHFVWAEFAAPRSRRLFRRPGGAVIGTFHASARRQPEVLLPRFDVRVFDAVTLMSASQKPFMLERGVPEDRLHVFLHGVDTAHFAPATRPRREGPLQMMLIGSTERDHAFAADVMRRLPAGCAVLSVCTPREQQVHYRDVPSTTVMPYLDSAALLQLYQQSDLLFMPMLDCTANNAVLEAMACGTPVLVNRIGGIPEYVDPACNVVLADKRVDEWVDRVRALAADRSALEQRRGAVRAWAERFAWAERAAPYRALFQQLAARGDV